MLSVANIQNDKQPFYQKLYFLPVPFLGYCFSHETIKYFSIHVFFPLHFNGHSQFTQIDAITHSKTGVNSVDDDILFVICKVLKIHFGDGTNGVMCKSTKTVT